MSSPGTRLPRETAHSAPSTSYSDSKAQKHLLKKLHKANLAVAESGALGAKVAEATVKKKRKRAANVESTQNWRLNTSDMSSKQKKLERSRKKPRSSSKRPGASKSRPITIDSDDNRDTEDNGESDGSVEILISVPVARLPIDSVSTPSRYHTITLPARGRSGSIHEIPSRKTVSSQPIPTVQPKFQAKRVEQHNGAESEVVEDETPIQIKRKGHNSKEIRSISSSRKHRKPHKNHRERSLEAAPGSSHRDSTVFPAAVGSKRRGRSPKNVQKENESSAVEGLRNDTTEGKGTNVPPLRTYRHPWTEPAMQNPQDLALGHIPDSDFRNKVARLMAVAPGLPVRDLYHLLIEKKGHFEETLKHVVARASYTPTSPTPSALPHVSQTQQASTAKILLDESSAQESDEEEIMVKLDLDDPAFIYDNDAPETPPPQIRRRPQTKQRSKGKSHKNRANQSKILKANASFPIKAYTHPYKRKGTAYISIKKNSHNTDTRLRETSSDREFIIADDVTFTNSSDSYHEESERSDEENDAAI